MYSKSIQKSFSNSDISVLSYSEHSTTGIKVNNKPEVEKVELNILTESHEDNTNCNTMENISRKYTKTKSTGIDTTNKPEDKKLHTERLEDNNHE